MICTSLRIQTMSSHSANNVIFSSTDISVEHKNSNHWLQIKNIHVTMTDNCNTCGIDDINKTYYMIGDYFGCSLDNYFLYGLVWQKMLYEYS